MGGKGLQKVTVEHVHVHSGGQAIVGSVETDRRPSQKEPEAIDHQQHLENGTSDKNVSPRLDTAKDCK